VGALRGDLEELVAGLRRVTRTFDAILPPGDLLAACRALEGEDARCEREVIGRTESGREIEAYVRGEGHEVLLYGFPDPGEAVGGTGILAMMRALWNDDPLLRQFAVRWRFIPCLNFDDQPEEGRVLVPVSRSEGVREVDWCLDAPRAETRALLEQADAHRPVFTFALHDEYHSGEPVPSYVGVTRPLPADACEAVRACLASFGLEVDGSIRHDGMGEGFFRMGATGPDFANSTFSVFGACGQVLVCEVAKAPEVPPADLVAAQLGVGLIALASGIGVTW
jgi:hypothetical protein